MLETQKSLLTLRRTSRHKSPCNPRETPYGAPRRVHGRTIMTPVTPHLGYRHGAKDATRRFPATRAAVFHRPPLVLVSATPPPVLHRAASVRFIGSRPRRPSEPRAHYRNAYHGQP